MITEVFKVNKCVLYTYPTTSELWELSGLCQQLMAYISLVRLGIKRCPNWN